MDAAVQSLAPSLRRSRMRRVLGVCIDVCSLGKPNIIVLLLITTSCAMLLAGKGVVHFKIFLLTIAGGALISASANAINCIVDRDIDAVMRRTKNRPLPAGRLSLTTAASFAFATGSAGFFLLLDVNLAAALAALTGHLIYVFVYTIWLKRTSPQNIVIGGAAGAIPPVVGWLAVTGALDLSAVCLFLLIFFWTPPHFWALALNKNEDYRRAGVPMLPAVAGEEATYRQMRAYALLLLPVSALLVYANSELGMLSLAVLIGLACAFVWLIEQLFRAASASERTRAAWTVFSFSLIYLAAVFLCVVIDSTVV